MNSGMALRQLSNICAGLGFAGIGLPFFESNAYRNLFFATGAFFLFLAWMFANLEKGRFRKSSEEWKKQKQVLIGMTACAALGLGLLVYYELQIPKYEVAVINKELYRVPPQLSKKQLLSLGAECNTYGNTLCSHDVFAKIVRLDPRDYKALGNLAMAQSHLGFHTEAIINFENAIKNGIASFDVLKFYGHSQWALGNKSMAVKAYKQSLLLNPNQDLLIERIKE